LVVNAAESPRAPSSFVSAFGEAPIFRPGDPIRISTRSPISDYRMPFYLRGKRGTVEALIEPSAARLAETGHSRSGESRQRSYRLAIPMTEIWPDYVGSPRDGLRIEVCEPWLTRM
jgi:nitrile hydratase